MEYRLRPLYIQRGGVIEEQSPQDPDRVFSTFERFYLVSQAVLQAEWPE